MIRNGPKARASNSPRGNGRRRSISSASPRCCCRRRRRPRRRGRAACGLVECLERQVGVGAGHDRPRHRCRCFSRPPGRPARRRKAGRRAVRMTRATPRPHGGSRHGPESRGRTGPESCARPRRPPRGRSPARPAGEQRPEAAGGTRCRHDSARDGEGEERKHEDQVARLGRRVAAEPADEEERPSA